MRRHTRWTALLVTLSLLPPPAANAQWVVTDPTNLVENVISAVQQVNAVLHQLEQYKTQLDQYTAQLRDIAAPAVFVWDLGKDTVETGVRVTRRLADFKQQIRDVNDALRPLGDPDYYRWSPCYNARAAAHGDCGVILSALQEKQRANLQTQHEANEQMFASLDDQHNSMTKRQARLQELIKTSQGADGQMKVLQAANQLTSAQIAELMEIRSLMITQQNIAVEEKRAQLAQKAAADAAAASFLSGEHEPTPNPGRW